MKKFFALALVSILLISAAAASGQKESGKDLSLQNVVDKGTFVLGLDDSFPPMGFRDENGEIVGFDIDVAREVASRLGTELVPQPIDWNAKEQELATGNIDCIWNGMTVTDELKEAILLTDPYLVNQQVVVVRSADKDKYKTTADLANAQSIAFEGGSAAESVLGDLNIDESKLLSQEKQLDTFLEVKTGSSDIAVVDKTLAQSICGTGDYKDLTFVDVGFAEEEFAVGFRKSDSELCSQIDELLAKYATDGTIAGLKEKYGIN